MRWPSAQPLRRPVRRDASWPHGQELLARLSQATELGTGQPASVGPGSYWADSAFIGAAGIPTVLYGPPGDRAHADIEWVSIEGTRTCADVLLRLAADFCAAETARPMS